MKSFLSSYASFFLLIVLTFLCLPWYTLPILARKQLANQVSAAFAAANANEIGGWLGAQGHHHSYQTSAIEAPATYKDAGTSAPKITKMEASVESLEVVEERLLLNQVDYAAARTHPPTEP